MKTSIAALVLLVLTLAAFDATNTRKPQFQVWNIWSAKLVDPPGKNVLRTPEMQRMIKDINVQLPLCTVQTWSDKDVKTASEYFGKVIKQNNEN